MVLRRKPVEEAGADGESIRTLLQRLATDTEGLLRAEVALAKLEFRDIARQTALDGAKIGAAVAVAFVGALALAAWAVLVIGDALGDAYGSAALIVGGVLLLTGALLARSGAKGLKRDRGPSETKQSLQASKAWAQEELKQLRTGLAAAGEADALPGSTTGRPPITSGRS